MSSQQVNGTKIEIDYEKYNRRANILLSAAAAAVGVGVFISFKTLGRAGVRKSLF